MQITLTDVEMREAVGHYLDEYIFQEPAGKDKIEVVEILQQTGVFVISLRPIAFTGGGLQLPTDEALVKMEYQIGATKI